MTKREMTIEEAIEIFKEVRAEVLAKETELSRQVFENLGIKAIDLAIKALEQQPNRCDSCTHSKEQDGSNCYECVKGMADNFETQPADADCISRVRLLEHLENITMDTNPDHYECKYKWYQANGFNLCKVGIEIYVKNLPDVTPKAESEYKNE